MAGGKETPRQKMIGMMYLVLTALLALNVSKSILDAFVSLEESIQQANMIQADRGNGFMADVTSEIAAIKDDGQKAKKEKLKYVEGRMKDINKETEEMIKFIDGLKLEILKIAGENTTTYKDKDHATLLWRKQDGCTPIRMNCDAVQGKDKYDEPMNVMGIAEDIKRPNGNGAELWKRLNAYRAKMVELAATYKMPNSENGFSFKPTKEINDFENVGQLTKEVEKMIDGSKANLKEDKQVLIDLYVMLSKKEKHEVHGVKDVHWVGTKFDHSPLVAGVAALSSLEQDILMARARALSHFKSKVSTGEYSFNKIMPLAYGPAVANANEDIELQVMMAAFDSDNQPTVTLAEGASGEVSYPGNGQGIVKFRAGGSTMNLKGTVSIKNKSGVPKTEDWEYTVTVMKPSGSIELPELNVLYRGYPNKVDPTASGYPTTVLTGSGCTVSKSGNIYVAKPGKAKKAYLTVSGKTADGKTVQLKKVEYRVSNLPDPELYWGAAKNGQKGSKAETRLFAKYPPEIPLNATFKIVNWECSVPGAAGRPPSGTGSNIGAASGLLRAAKSGSQVSFICTVVGPDGVRRKKAGAFKI